MWQPDRIPPTKLYEPFPVGDIDNATLTKGYAWIHDIEENYDYPKFAEKIQSGLYPESYEDEAEYVRDTNLAAVRLCKEWGKISEGDGRFATAGYMAAQTFVLETQILPSLNCDLTVQMNQMRKEGVITAKKFAQEAWKGMEYNHPRVHYLFASFYDFSATMFNDIHQPANEDLYRAGMALVYMMSSTASLDHMAKMTDFTGMTNDKKNEKNLQVNDFGEFFSNRENLEYRDPSIRLIDDFYPDDDPEWC